MKMPTGNRDASPLARAMRENAERRRRQNQQRLERNSEILDRLPEKPKGKPA